MCRKTAGGLDFETGDGRQDGVSDKEIVTTGGGLGGGGEACGLRIGAPKDGGAGSKVVPATAVEHFGEGGEGVGVAI